MSVWILASASDRRCSRKHRQSQTQRDSHKSTRLSSWFEVVWFFTVFLLRRLPVKNWFFLLALFCLVACGRTESSLPGARRLAAQWSVAEAGLSCDEACADQGMACSENFWPTDPFEFEDIVSDVGAECVAKWWVDGEREEGRSGAQGSPTVAPV